MEPIFPLIQFCERKPSTDALRKFMNEHPYYCVPYALSTCYAHCTYHKLSATIIRTITNAPGFDPLKPGKDDEYPLISALLYGSLAMLIEVVSRTPKKTLAKRMNDLESNHLRSSLVAIASISRISPFPKAQFMLSISDPANPASFINKTDMNADSRCVELHKEYLKNPSDKIIELKATPLLIAKYHEQALVDMIVNKK